MSDTANAVPFSDLGLSETVLRAVKAIGYESASPIQAATIPAMATTMVTASTIKKTVIASCILRSPFR